jgi:creatinine amidohydrolase
MHWIELTSDDLARARTEADGVALVPIGSIERHGPHLPLGCDTHVATAVADRVAAAEPVVVLPTIPYTFVSQCIFQPGAVHIKGSVLVDHLACICDEMHRNGFSKIALMHAHGGNMPMSHGILHHALEERKPWAVYSIPPLAGTHDVIRELRETEHFGHAGEIETSVALALFPELCRMERTEGALSAPSGRPDLGVAETAVDWIAEWPGMMCGEPAKASAEKGERIVAAWVDAIVDALRRIKADDTVPEHHRRARAQPDWD